MMGLVGNCFGVDIYDEDVERGCLDRPLRIRDLAVGDRFMAGSLVFVRMKRNPSAEMNGELSVKCCDERDAESYCLFHLDDLVYRAAPPPLVKEQS